MKNKLKFSQRIHTLVKKNLIKLDNIKNKSKTNTINEHSYYLIARLMNPML